MDDPLHLRLSQLLSVAKRENDRGPRFLLFVGEEPPFWNCQMNPRPFDLRQLRDGSRQLAL